MKGETKLLFTCKDCETDFVDLNNTVAAVPNDNANVPDHAKAGKGNREGGKSQSKPSEVVDVGWVLNNRGKIKKFKFRKHCPMCGSSDAEPEWDEWARIDGVEGIEDN